MIEWDPLEMMLGPLSVTMSATLGPQSDLWLAAAWDLLSDPKLGPLVAALGNRSATKLVSM